MANYVSKHTGAQIDAAVENVGVLDGKVTTLSEEIAENDIPKVFFVGAAPTSKAQGELPLTMEFISKTVRFKNFVTLKVQGDSSSSYPKKTGI